MCCAKCSLRLKTLSQTAHVGTSDAFAAAVIDVLLVVVLVEVVLAIDGALIICTGTGFFMGSRGFDVATDEDVTLPVCVDCTFMSVSVLMRCIVMPDLVGRGCVT